MKVSKSLRAWSALQIKNQNGQFDSSEVFHPSRNCYLSAQNSYECQNSWTDLAAMSSERSPSSSKDMRLAFSKWPQTCDESGEKQGHPLFP